MIILGGLAVESKVRRWCQLPRGRHFLRLLARVTSSNPEVDARQPAALATAVLIPWELVLCRGCNLAVRSHIVNRSVNPSTEQPLFSIPPLRIARLLFELRPTGPLHLPLEQRGNVLRGAFGRVFQRAVCDPDCPGARSCTRRDSCAYARLFEPRWEEGAQFGAEDAPRPFVFRPSLNSDPDFGPHRPLLFELRLFGEAISAAEHFVHAFQLLADTGLADRSVHLESVDMIDWMGQPHVSLVREVHTAHVPAPLVLSLEQPCAAPVLTASTVAVDFATPTWLRENGRDLRVPTFTGLVQRVRDRTSTLCQIYGKCEWQADFRAISNAAARATTVDWEGGWAQHHRTSTRTGQRMPMAGFRGTVVFSGVDQRLWPLLLIGQEIHVGRHTAWGHGWYRVQQQ